jgi:hypothetical protein
MDLCEQVAALFLGDAPHEDAIGATMVEIPFYHSVSLSQSHYALSGYMVFRKVVVFQVVPDLEDPCIGTLPRVWMQLLKIFENLEGAHNPWRTPRMEHRRDHWIRDARLTPFAQFGRLGGWFQQPSLKDSLRHGCLS